ncbi:hypothetical protein DRJ17_01555 [Candidatus Woesearchaeota archaeon]|nr:MAG: hypothetical protein DRJ17_01555 [Candidatus Woesearchaeota archaeon]
MKVKDFHTKNRRFLDMNKVYAMLMVFVIIVSMLPFTLAQGNIATSDMDALKGEESPVSIVKQGIRTKKPIINQNIKDDVDIQDDIRQRIEAKLQVVEECVKNLIEEKGLSEEEAKRACGLRAVVAKKIVERVREIKKFNMTDFREFQKQQLMVSIEKCKELGLPKEKCEEKLKLKIKNIERLKEKDLERLRTIEEKKLVVAKRLNELKEDKYFSKFKNKTKARLIVKSKLEAAKKKFSHAKELFEERREKFNLAKEKIEAKKLALQACKDQETEECEQIREQAKEDAKNFLGKSADVILAALEKVRAKIETAEDLSDEEAAELLAKVDERIKIIEEAKEIIETSEDRWEIRKVASQIRAAWRNTKPIVERATGKLVNARIGVVVVRARQLEAKLERVLGRMVINGKDIEPIRSKIDEFKTHMDAAKADFKSAETKFKEAKEAEDADSKESALKEAKMFISSAKNHLKEARETMKAILLQIKAQGGETELEEDEELGLVEPSAEIENGLEEEEEETIEDEEEDVVVETEEGTEETEEEVETEMSEEEAEITTDASLNGTVTIEETDNTSEITSVNETE